MNIYITFTGPPATGKSLVLNMVKRMLVRKGCTVASTGEHILEVSTDVITGPKPNKK